MAGTVFKNIDQATKQKLQLTGGVQITTLKAGPWKKAGIQQGFIITAIGKEIVDNVDQLTSILQRREGGVLIEGVYPNGEKIYYGVDLGS